MVTPKDVYPSFIQLIIHAETISWTRFYHYLVFNTILILAWATIYSAPGDPPRLKVAVTAAVCFIGALSGVFWALLGARGRKFLRKYIGVTKEFEADLACWPAALEKYRLGTLTREWGKNGGSRSGYFVIGGPVVFTLLYLFLLYVSIT